MYVADMIALLKTKPGDAEVFMLDMCKGVYYEFDAVIASDSRTAVVFIAREDENA